MKFLHDVWPDLPPRFQVHFNSLLSLINGKLVEAAETLDYSVGKQSQYPSLVGLTGKGGKVHRLGFAMSTKRKIDATIQSLDSWQHNMLDPSWYQLVFVPSNKRLDKTVADSDYFPGPISNLKKLRDLARNSNDGGPKMAIDTMSSDSIEIIPSGIEFSQSQLGIERSSRTLVLLDAVVDQTGGRPGKIGEDVQYLKKRLSSVDSEAFGLLECRGVLDMPQVSARGPHFAFVFSFPKGYDDPTNLRRLLLDADKTYPLNARVQIAQRLARSTVFLHTFQIVHKNIRPENVVCFGSQGGKPDRPYLIGFERFRMASASSERIGDAEWQREIYRHPSRQGARPEQDYIMQHDIYSLGVCLLEIGFWTSFLDPTTPSPNCTFLSVSDLDIKDPRKRAFEIKKRFVKMAEEWLPGRIGQMYASIVVSCLTCLDPGNDDFGDEKDLEDETGDSVGLRYAEKVSCFYPTSDFRLTFVDPHASFVNLVIIDLDVIVSR